jgi:hypothetical protein
LLKVEKTVVKAPMATVVGAELQAKTVVITADTLVDREVGVVD